MATGPDTIAAIATAQGTGAVGVVRVSGPLAAQIGLQVCAKALNPRTAHYRPFADGDGSPIDAGIALFFPAPASYTGEDVLELQAHGGSVVLSRLLNRVLALGARPARPGEFTERAFLNGKLDLAQAEAVADLINASTEQAARSAQRSLQGLFSRQIDELLTELVELRAYIEAAIDFVDEDIDFIGDGVVEARLNRLLARLGALAQTAGQGRLLRDGMTVVLAGQPNAGKSSLLNALAGHEAAIVTDMAGTTRDVLKERIQLDGMPLHIIDTAGLRASDDPIEQEGMRRAHAEIHKADRVLWLIDASQPTPAHLPGGWPPGLEVTNVHNKIDLLGLAPAISHSGQGTDIWLSVKTGAGMDLLVRHLKDSAGYRADDESVFTARSRHLAALRQAEAGIGAALAQLRAGHVDELLAEELRLAQNSLAEITGAFTADDLLGEIFASFCIGK